MLNLVIFLVLLVVAAVVVRRRRQGQPAQGARAQAGRARAGAPARLRGRHRAGRGAAVLRPRAGRPRARRRARTPTTSARWTSTRRRRRPRTTSPSPSTSSTSPRSSRTPATRWRASAPGSTGQPLPTRRPPCFFDPRHGLSVEDVPYAPPGGAQRDVPACALDAERVHAGAEPDIRKVMVGNRRVPYFQGGRAYQPYAAGYFGGFGPMDLMFMGMLFGGGFDGIGDGIGAHRRGPRRGDRLDRRRHRRDVRRHRRHVRRVRLLIDFATVHLCDLPVTARQPSGDLGLSRSMSRPQA